jgi:hypothetical protein
MDANIISLRDQRHTLRQRMEAAVERLIAALSDIDSPFEDLEPEKDRESDGREPEDGE